VVPLDFTDMISFIHLFAQNKNTVAELYDNSMSRTTMLQPRN